MSSIKLESEIGRSTKRRLSKCIFSHIRFDYHVTSIRDAFTSIRGIIYPSYKRIQNFHLLKIIVNGLTFPSVINSSWIVTLLCHDFTTLALSSSLHASWNYFDLFLVYRIFLLNLRDEKKLDQPLTNSARYWRSIMFDHRIKIHFYTKLKFMIAVSVTV